MQDQILRFISILRKTGVRISIDEVSNCLMGMAYIELLDRQEFKTLLQSTLIKRSDDLTEFNRLFDLFFTLIDVSNQISSPKFLADRHIDQVQMELVQKEDFFSPAFKDLLLKDIQTLITNILEASLFIGKDEIKYPLQTHHYIRVARDKLGITAWRMETSQLLIQLEGRGISDSDRSMIQKGISRKVELLDTVIQEYIPKRASAYLNPNGMQPSSDYIMKKNLGNFTDQDITTVQYVVRQLRRKLQSEDSRRNQQSRRGIVDIKNTLRRNQRYGGIPLEISVRRRRKTKTRVAVLCDISDSVRYISSMMLFFVYSIQEHFHRVRSFVFVDQLGEVTGFFERFEIGEAIENAFNRAGISHLRYTDYGTVFKQLYEQYSDFLNRRTTLIVIGDARNNYYESGELFFSRIKQRVSRVFWINPEKENYWCFGDSLMHRYAEYCDEVFTCQNLQQLIGIVERI